MVESDWVKKRLEKFNDSYIEWLGTFFFVGGFLFVVVLFRYVDKTEPSVLRTLIWLFMVSFGAIYSLFFLGSLGSFFPRPKEEKTFFEKMIENPFFQRHPKLINPVKFVIGIIIYLFIFQSAIYCLMALYDLLLISAQIPDIVVAILVAILIEQFFQLLGLGFKNMIKYSNINETQESNSTEESN